MDYTVANDGKEVLIHIEAPDEDSPIVIRIFKQDGKTRVQIMDHEDGAKTELTLGRLGYTKA